VLPATVAPKPTQPAGQLPNSGYGDGGSGDMMALALLTFAGAIGIALTAAGIRRRTR
jgi:hypothetical protein